ncbi:hypothetical protein ACFQ10_01040 [Streptomyces indonesiensis]
MTPHPKLFQLFQPSGGVSAGLPGAAWAAEWAEAVVKTVPISAAAVRKRSNRPPGFNTRWFLPGQR